MVTNDLALDHSDRREHATGGYLLGEPTRAIEVCVRVGQGIVAVEQVGNGLLLTLLQVAHLDPVPDVRGGRSNRRGH